MATHATGLDVLRERTIVDCDTMDEQVAKTLGPFQDCTSNQAVAYGELSKPEHARLVEFSVLEAKEVSYRFSGINVPELAVEIAVVQLFQHLDPTFDAPRICIKILSTWEGLMACRTLEAAGIRTLATTLFTWIQAAVAAEVGCTYVAPYVNQLKVHFEPGFKDPHKLLPLCVSIQKYYEVIGSKTQVLPASLTFTEEIFSLAGVQHITIAPGLLQHLSQPSSAPQVESLFDSDSQAPVSKAISYVGRESVYRFGFSRSERGSSEENLTQAINIFCDMQDKLIELMRVTAGRLGVVSLHK